jgi:uncharacterized membrane protein YbhN (UPF0104 family)
MPSPLQRLVDQSKPIISRLKPYLRWVILGGTLFFVASTLRQHWSEVMELRVDAAGWGILMIAMAFTLLAHVWSGWVWSWILRELNQPAKGIWGISVYLKTNIAKYLPGNVWHFYGRIVAATEAGFPTGAATLSVLLEPLLMAAAALIITLIGTLISLNSNYVVLKLLSLGLVLIAIHPKFLNPVLKLVGRLKTKSARSAAPHSATPDATTSNSAIPNASVPVAPQPSQPVQLKRYPLFPILGEVFFVFLRGIGFLFCVMVLASLNLAQVPLIISAFSFAWLLGLVVPGAPGGIGIFEATAIALLDSQLPPAIVLGSVALYRLISTLAEAVGAGAAWLGDRWIR